MKLTIVKDKHDGHINIDEFVRLSQIKTEESSDANFAWLREMNDKIDSCDICKKRYRRYIAVQTFFPGDFAAFEPRKETALSSVAALLQDKLAVLDAKIRANVEAWLDSAQNLLGSLEQSSFRPALAGATRGAGGADAELIIPAPVGDGNFEFELSEKTDVIFRIPRKTEDGLPVCLVIAGRGGADFSAVYPLTGLELPGVASPLLDSPKITLEAGEYALCVPTIEEESN
jgi:hypothetical protein